jgi:DNA invertase Pin-like site-specific DNA recombinase
MAEDGRAKVGIGMLDQREKVEAWCRYREVPLVAWVDSDVDKSGKTLARPGMQEVLARLDAGEAEVLVAAKLNRLARSVTAFGELMGRADRGGWAIVVLDFDLDTSTPTGRCVANILMAVAQMQREQIAEDTRDALALKARQGMTLGRRRTMPDEVVARIRRERLDDGRSLQAIADGLNADKVPTAQGGARWHPSTVHAALNPRSVVVS